MTGVYVALGTNIQPMQNTRLALHELAKSFPGLQVSPLYRNEPVGFEGADFINAVVGFDSSLPVDGVIAELRRIETLCGRPRDAPKQGLTLPRPDLLKKSYMLKPLADIAPGLIHPIERRSMAELWRDFDAAQHRLTPVSL
jgi:2-amino-4-hydroxy-6-hydroxymethyldihydropteridine diphosphokinase